MGVEVAAAVGPRAPFVEHPGGEPYGRVVERIAQGLRSGRLDGAVAALGGVPPCDVVDVGLLLGGQRRGARPGVRPHLGGAQVDADHSLGLRQRHVGGDTGTEVAAVRAVPLVAEPLHELVPQPRDVRPVDAGTGRSLREGVTRQRRDDKVEAVAEPVDSESSSTNVLGQPWVSTSGTAAAPAATVHEVQADPVDLGQVVLVAVEPALLPAPVEPVGPVGRQGLQVVAVDALAPRLARRRVGPTGVSDAPMEVVQHRVRHRHLIRFGPHPLTVVCQQRSPSSRPPWYVR